MPTYSILTDTTAAGKMGQARIGPVTAAGPAADQKSVAREPRQQPARASIPAEVSRVF